MAGYTLSTQRMPKGGSVGGLNADMLQANGGAGAINAARIAQGAGNVKYTNTNIPQPVENQVSKGIQHFMGATAQAAFKYQDREAQYLANNSIIEFKKELNKAYHGYEDEDGKYHPGYSNLSKFDAVNGYGSFVDGADFKMRDMLEDMEPNVRAKALIQMHTAKSEYSSRAANHRAKEFGAAEDEQNYMTRHQLSIDIGSNPDSINIPDASGVTQLDRYVATFAKEGVEASDNAVYDLMQKLTEEKMLKQTSKRASTPQGRVNNVRQGVADAMEFYNNTSRHYLAGSEKHRVAMLSNFRRWERESITAEHDAYSMQSKMLEDSEKKNRANGDAMLLSKLINNEPITATELSAITLAQGANKDVINNVNSVLFKNGARTIPSDVYQGEFDAIQKLAEAGDLDALRRYKVGSSDQMIYRDTTSLARLEAVKENFLNPKLNYVYKVLEDDIKNWLLGDLITTVGKVGVPEKTQLYNQARTELVGLSAKGMPIDDARVWMSNKYQPLAMKLAGATSIGVSVPSPYSAKASSWDPVARQLDAYRKSAIAYEKKNGKDSTWRDMVKTYNLHKQQFMQNKAKWETIK